MLRKQTNKLEGPLVKGLVTRGQSALQSYTFCNMQLAFLYLKFDEYTLKNHLII